LQDQAYTFAHSRSFSFPFLVSKSEPNRLMCQHAFESESSTRSTSQPRAGVVTTRWQQQKTKKYHPVEKKLRWFSNAMWEMATSSKRACHRPKAKRAAANKCQQCVHGTSDKLTTNDMPPHFCVCPVIQVWD